MRQFLPGRAGIVLYTQQWQLRTPDHLPGPGRRRRYEGSLTERSAHPHLASSLAQGVKASPFGTRDGHDPERAGALRPVPARASPPQARRGGLMALDVPIIRVPRLTWFTAHIVLRYGQEGVAVTCACRLARMRTTWAQED